MTLIHLEGDPLKFFYCLVILLFTACSTPPKDIAPAMHLLSTNKTPSELIPDLEASFEKYKYAVKAVNPQVGLLSLEPRTFTVKASDQDIAAKQVVAMRQEGGSLKLRIFYSCIYKGEKFQNCNQGHPEVVAKIRRLNALVLNVVNKQLIKDASDKPQSTSIGEINPEAEGSTPK